MYHWRGFPFGVAEFGHHWWFHQVPPTSNGFHRVRLAESVMCCISSLVIISSSTCTRSGESTEDLFCWYVMTPSGANPRCQGNSLQRYSGSCIPVMCPQNSSSSGKFLSEGCTCNEGFLGNEICWVGDSFAFFLGKPTTQYIIIYI